MHINNHHNYSLQCSASREQYKFAMYCFSIMVNCSSLQSLIDCVQTCNVVFSSQFLDENVRSAIDKITKWTKQIGDIDANMDEEEIDMKSSGIDDDIVEDLNASDDELAEEEHIHSGTWKPFGAFFSLTIKKYVQVTSSGDPNPVYKPELIQKLAVNWLPTAPFWSSMLRGLLNEAIACEHNNALFRQRFEV